MRMYISQNRENSYLKLHESMKEKSARLAHKLSEGVNAFCNLIARLKGMRSALGATCVAILAGTASAQPDVTWQAPVTISGTADVSTRGAYFGSWAPQNGGANNYPVNGVTFQGFSDLPGQAAGPTFDNGYNGFGSPNTPDGTTTRCSNTHAFPTKAPVPHRSAGPEWFQEIPT